MSTEFNKYILWIYGVKDYAIIDNFCISIVVSSLLIPSMYLYLIFNIQELCNPENVFIKLLCNSHKSNITLYLTQVLSTPYAPKFFTKQKGSLLRIPKYFIKESLNPYQKCIYKIPPHSTHHTTNSTHPPPPKKI